MPRGKFTNHKGRNRRFTNPEELEEERRKEEEKRKWRQQRGVSSSSEEEEEGDGDKGSDEEGSEEESSSDGEPAKAKGVSNLIEIENPNRVQKKTKKLTTLDKELKVETNTKPELSRREREEIEKQRAQAHYQKLHAEGKTDQARADLARLAIIKQQREEARKRREAEQKEREDAVKQKTAQTHKALGKK